MRNKFNSLINSTSTNQRTRFGARWIWFGWIDELNSAIISFNLSSINAAATLAWFGHSISQFNSINEVEFNSVIELNWIN